MNVSPEMKKDLQHSDNWAYFLSIMKVTGVVCLVAVLFNVIFWAVFFLAVWGFVMWRSY